MTVKKASEILNKLVEQGHGNLPLILIDQRSGSTDELRISSSESEISGDEAMGQIGDLLDLNEGEKYVAGYIG